MNNLLNGALPLSSQHALNFAEKYSLDSNSRQSQQFLDQNIAFVTADLADVEALIQGLEDMKVVLIGEQQNGIDQITSVLAQYDSLNEVHIFSHGDRGSLQLGSTTLNNTNRQKYDSNFQQWGQALSDKADILLYGCHFAATDEGVALVDSISRSSGADVAASDDLTGMGGDWQLEVKRGEIESQVALNATTQANYKGTLETSENGGLENNSDVFTYEGNQYVLTTAAANWTAAQAEAESLGGNLVTINSAAEEAWLKQTFGDEERLWIGLNDATTEGQFEWVSGEELDYINWAANEPNNFRGSQHYGVMNYSRTKQWDDEFNRRTLFGIVEIGGSNAPGNENPDDPNDGENPPAPNYGFIGLASSTLSIDESAGTVEVTVQRTGGSDGEVTVDYRTVESTDTENAAIAGADYQARTGTLTFADDQTQGSIFIPIVDDTLTEGAESLGFVIDNVNGGATLLAPRTASITINDNDSDDNNDNSDVFTYEGNQYVLTTAAANWTAAQAEAESLGGNLVTINSAAEEAWLKQTFGDEERLWIGLNDATTEGQFEWVSGEELDYINWAANEPNNFRGSQHYGVMNYSRTKQWDDEFNRRTLFGIVEIGGSNAPGNENPDDPNDGENPPAPNYGFIGLASSTLSIDESAGTVEVTVQRTGGSDGEVTVDYRTVESTDTENAAIAGADYQARTGTLTFADDQTQGSIFIPIVDDTLTEGAESFGFAIDNVTGGATLLAPRTARITINDNDSDNNDGNDDNSDGNDDELSYEDNQYVLTTGAKTWTEAQAEAESLGGNLVTINSAAEEAWLKETFGRSKRFWIGLNDVDTEGQFEWVSGEELDYINWAPNEPNNSKGRQHYGVMNYSETRQWDDESGTRKFTGIIEIGESNPPEGPPSDPEEPPSDPNGGNAPIAETIISGLSAPTAVEWRAGSNQMFVAEKAGKVFVYENETLLSTPFIDISAQVNSNRDRGLLDLALHPDFANNPYVYLLFTYDPPEVNNYNNEAGPDGRGNRAGRLIRVTADAANGYRTAVAGSEVVLLGKNSTWDNFNGFVNSTVDFDEPEAGVAPDGSYIQDFLNADSRSHTVGAVEFGPDGTLYVSNGDGASYNRPDRRAVRVQDIDSLSGKVLRIDPLTGEGLSDNSFFNGDTDANRSKVYQLGLRNPFRMTIDPNSGQLYIGDVGWTRWEEINAAGPGANFGWPYYEGGNGISNQTSRYSAFPEAQNFYESGSEVVPSLLALSHAEDGINAIVMGDIYRGNVYADKYQGDLFFNDLGQGIVRNVSLDASGNVTDVETFTTGATYVVQIIEGPDGLLYYVNLLSGTVGRWVFDED